MLDKFARQVIEQNKESIPYSNLYAGLPSNVKFVDLPFLTSTHLSNFYFHDSLDRDGSICVYFTSGTISEPKAVYYNTTGAQYISDYIKWFCEMEGACGGERVAVLLGQSFWGAGYFTVQGHIKAGNVVSPIDSGLSKEVIADLIRVFQPSVISSTPSLLMGLRKYLKNISLKIIETTGEILETNTRVAIEKHFNAKVFDAYGLTEGMIGTECSQHDGYHFLPDKVYLELLDLETEEIISQDGDSCGELVMTVLCHSAMPIVRYKTGDVCKISHTQCACGNVYPRIWICGRKEKTISLYEGVKIGEKELQSVLQETLGSKYKYDVVSKIKNNKAILEIITEESDRQKIKKAKNKIVNISYETIYLYNARKLSILFRKP